MRREHVSIRKRVKMLTDPQPDFVSLVPAGANGTPLRVVKSDEMEPQMPTNLKHGNADIARIVFRGEAFSTIEAVQAWLTAGGYKDVAPVAKDDGSFEVVDANADTFKDVSVIETDDGVSIYVGELEAAPQPSAKAEVVAVAGQKTEEPRTGARKQVTDEQAEAKALADSTLTAEEWGGLQQSTRDKYIGIARAALEADTGEEASEGQTDKPSVHPVAPDAPAEGELPTLLTKDDKGLIRVVSRKGAYEVTNLTEIIRALSWLKDNVDFETYANGADGEAAVAIRSAIGTLGQALISLATQVVTEAAKSDDAPPAAVEGDGLSAEGQEKKPVEASAKTEDGNTAETTGNSALPEAILSAVKGLTDAVTTFGTQIGSLKETVEQNAAKADTLEKRLAKVETTSQTRKSADVEDLVPAKPQEVKTTPAQKSAAEISREVRAQNSAALLGI